MSVFDLWLPILVTAIATHVYGTLAWTALPHHKPEWTKIPDEDGAYPALEKIPAGQYIFPHASCQKDLQEEAFQRKMKSRNGMLAHIAAKFPFVCWFRRRIAMEVLDGVIFALLTGVIFAALWPK